MQQEIIADTHLSLSEVFAVILTALLEVDKIIYTPYKIVSLAKLAIIFLVPAVSKPISSIESPPAGITFKIIPLPNVLCKTVCPTEYLLDPLEAAGDEPTKLDLFADFEAEVLISELPKEKFFEESKP